MRYKLQLAISLILAPFIPLIIGKWHDFALFIGMDNEESFISGTLFSVVIFVIYILNAIHCTTKLTNND